MKWGIRGQVLLALTLVVGFGLIVSFWVTSSLMNDALVDDHVARIKYVAPLVQTQLQSNSDPAALADAVKPDKLLLLDGALTPLGGDKSSITKPIRDLAQAAQSKGQVEAKLVTGPEGTKEVIVAIPVGSQIAVIISSLAPTEGRSAVLTNLLLLFTVIILCLALIPGHIILGRLVVRPLTRLVRFVERIGGGEFTQLTTTDAAPSEVGQLYSALERMNRQLALDRTQIQEQLEALKQAHQDLQETTNRLVMSEKLATVGTLAAGVAHEIGNPIAVLQGYIELLEDTDLSDAQAKTYIGAMQSAVEKVSSIIKELLTFARPVEIGDSACDVKTSVQSAINLARYPNLSKNVTFSFSAPEQDLVAAMSAGKLEQVLLNLLMNAAHASPDGGEVRADITDDETTIAIKVSDEGDGISKPNLIKVFDPFFTTKEPGEGTGLGLAVSHHIITGYGGTLTVRNLPERGACFTVTVPKWVSEPA